MPEQSNYIDPQSQQPFNPGGGGMQVPMGWQAKTGRLKLNKVFIPGGLTYHTIIVKYNSSFTEGEGNWITGVEHHYKQLSETDEMIGSYETSDASDIYGNDLAFAYIPIKYKINDGPVNVTSIGNLSYNISGSNPGWDEYYDDVKASGGVYPPIISAGTFGVISAKSVDVIPV